MKLIDDLNKMGRLEKFLASLIIVPVVLIGLFFVAFAVLTLPILALVCPDAIKFTHNQKS